MNMTADIISSRYEITFTDVG